MRFGTSGHYPAACRSYRTLADGYFATGAYETAVVFHEKLLSTCVAAGNTVGAAEAHGELGTVATASGDLGAAIAWHELQVATATSAGAEGIEQKRRGFQSLVGAYTAQAQDFEKSGDAELAVAMYEKCLEAARQCGDVVGEGMTQHRLGLTLASLGDTERAMQCQRLYRDSCAAQVPEPDQAGQGKACQALASAAHAAGDTDAACEYLEQCIELAASAEDTTAQSVGCAALGALYRSSSKHEVAVQYFEKFFELARAAETEEDDPSGAESAGGAQGAELASTSPSSAESALRLTDTARAVLGVARASAQFDAFAGVVKSDLPALLAWRNRRTPLERAGA
jgi:tetratricopeptide (TPR) repeat protein